MVRRLLHIEPVKSRSAFAPDGTLSSDRRAVQNQLSKDFLQVTQNFLILFGPAALRDSGSRTRTVGHVMSHNVAEFVWQRLSEWGFSRVYFYPGDGVGGLDMAPLPPHITLKDAKNLMMMTADEPEPGSVLSNSARRVLAGVLPHNS
jgi:hypothetical protein